MHTHGGDSQLLPPDSFLPLQSLSHDLIHKHTCTHQREVDLRMQSRRADRNLDNIHNLYSIRSKVRSARVNDLQCVLELEDHPFQYQTRLNTFALVTAYCDFIGLKFLVAVHYGYIHSYILYTLLLYICENIFALQPKTLKLGQDLV